MDYPPSESESEGYEEGVVGEAIADVKDYYETASPEAHALLTHIKGIKGLNTPVAAAYVLLVSVLKPNADDGLAAQVASVREYLEMFLRVYAESSFNTGSAQIALLTAFEAYATRLSGPQVRESLVPSLVSLWEDEVLDNEDAICEWAEDKHKLKAADAGLGVDAQACAASRGDLAGFIEKFADSDDDDDDE